MASAFAHALAAVTIGKFYPKKKFKWKFWILGMICAILPDADVIGFFWGIPYEHVLGHRGITHSLAFAIAWGMVVTLVFYRATQLFSPKGLLLSSYFALSTASHGLLDAMTSGGYGVAFFVPFDNSRYFLPWRPIKVSPIGVERFFSEWGVKVIGSELISVGIPCAILLLIAFLLNRLRK